MSVVDRSFDQPMKLEEHASMPLAGGIMQQGYQCGMLWGAALAAGAHAYRLLGPGAQAQAAAIRASQRLVESFQASNKEINCFEITEMDWKGTSQSQMTRQVLKFLVKGGPIGCFRMAAGYAPLAVAEIERALAETPDEAPPLPLSCSAALAPKMGLSEMHQVMAAGFAGGIGLCGGGCGALSAAIWIVALNSTQQPGAKIDFQDPQALEAIDRFLKASDYEFECAKIVGRKFASIADHAEYVRGRGCAHILDALAIQQSLAGAPVA